MKDSGIGKEVYGVPQEPGEAGEAEKGITLKCQPRHDWK